MGVPARRKNRDYEKVIRESLLIFYKIGTEFTMISREKFEFFY